MENSGPIREYTEDEIREENKRIRYLRRLVDFSMALIAQSPMSLDEAQRVVQAVRQQALRLFPEKEERPSNCCTPLVLDGLLQKSSACCNKTVKTRGG